MSETQQEVRFSGANADVTDALATLYRRHGRLRDHDVVETARDRASVLHGLFEWDDAAAAEKYRLEQAQGLIRRVRVQIVAGEKRVVRVRAYVSQTATKPVDEADVEPGTYKSVFDVAADEGMTSHLMDEIERDLMRLQVKYSSSELFFQTLRKFGT